MQRRDVEKEFFIRLYLEQYMFLDANKLYTVKDYYSLLRYMETESYTACLSLPPRQTIDAHIKVLEKTFQDILCSQTNPKLASEKEVFKTYNQKHFFQQLLGLTLNNITAPLSEQIVSIDFFPLYIGVISSIKKTYVDLSLFKEYALRVADSVFTALATPSETSTRKKEKYFQKFSIEKKVLFEIYAYLLNIFFPDSYFLYLTALDKYLSSSDVSIWERNNIAILASFRLPYPIESTMGTEYIFTNALAYTEKYIEHKNKHKKLNAKKL